MRVRPPCEEGKDKSGGCKSAEGASSFQRMAPVIPAKAGIQRARQRSAHGAEGRRGVSAVPAQAPSFQRRLESRQGMRVSPCPGEGAASEGANRTLHRHRRAHPHQAPAYETAPSAQPPPASAGPSSAAHRQARRRAHGNGRRTNGTPSPAPPRSAASE